MGRIARITALLVGAALVSAAIALSWAHAAIRALDPPLPAAEAVLGAASDAADLPVRVSLVNTARQPMPRSAVLESSRDPNPASPFAMAFPAFILEWADGRSLLIDAGMDGEAARAFGRPLELLAGADPIEPLDSLAERLGAGGASRRLAVVLTHLHSDHTQGLVPLCAGRAEGAPPIRLWQSGAQATRSNYTTRPGRGDLAAASCLQPHRLDPAALMSVPGYPGVFVIHAAGHTPGSQVVVAFARERDRVVGYAFIGDVANHIDGVRADVPKPLLYRLLAVPEDDSRLAQMRRLLRELEQGGMRLVVSHHLGQLQALGIPDLGEEGRPAAFAPNRGG